MSDCVCEITCTVDMINKTIITTSSDGRILNYISTILIDVLNNLFHNMLGLSILCLIFYFLYNDYKVNKFKDEKVK